MRAWTIVGGFFIALNLCSFALFGWDKSRARRDAWRISERALLLAAACFGGTGALLGMRAFRHKTRHWKFRILVPLFALLQWAALIAWAVYSQA
ncbi:MAG TPA: DUF1294 domain-containing protein [Candidatus Alectryocaccomicrobium excrementavium]|uniref:DUF1294 domain-containing protein n=1 Tax=Candidatus Alectryocaccomicrobium excrementavium TaxID=2840668 RepID=A0A9D1G215_9FIRM|nr:DUF1294 domain-containing protein [Candidatus Alectryocaccomicrobium excrementavium]